MVKPKLCLCLTGKTLRENLQFLERHHGSLDLAELRADFLEPPERRHLHRFPGQTDIPIVLTVRRAADGGAFAEGEEVRTDLILRALEGGYGYLDLEVDFRQAEIRRKARDGKVRIIRSLHELRGPRAITERRLKRLTERPGEIPKLAVLLHGSADLVQLLRLGWEFRQRLGNQDRILIGMGDYGIPTRILAARLGSFLGYASPSPTAEKPPGSAAADAVQKAPARAAAPGQLDVDSLLRIYRFREIGADTAVYGIAAKPVMHSFSPRIHNPAFAHYGMDAVYLPLLMDRADDLFELAEILDIRGVSVSIPHKRSIIPFLAQRDEAVTATGACNTLVRIPDARCGGDRGWLGANTDVAGFLSPLVPYLGDLSHRHATVIGAGGSARSVVYALRTEGFQVLILNRTAEKARDLAAQFGGDWGGLDASGAEKVSNRKDLIVQATSAGMMPNAGDDPFPLYRFGGGELVYDIVYNPPITRFLRRAREAGCRIIMGRDMLLGQAEAQFRLFTGKDLPKLDYDLPVGEG